MAIKRRKKTGAREMMAHWARVATEQKAMPYSCSQCDEKLMPGSQPIMIKGSGYCAECAAGAPTEVPKTQAGKIGDNSIKVLMEKLRGITLYFADGSVAGRFSETTGNYVAEDGGAA